MNQSRKYILDLVDTHAHKAHASQYDRDVCILAISAAREAVLSISPDVPPEAFTQQVQEKLIALVQRYHDNGGEYTSGKGVIGSLLDDIFAMKDN